ncbi:DUF413 domain-containing protein [Corallincola spongiicola]|uniref:Macrodomain Ori protein n=1 Tax=Corallincola spongiicola TaxID=2520508 RepID=A0ABY1WLA1_9GAMM|nr:DUF413 domain-containing protein [Corallincola spongiicola]TAA41116.1 DUF413 domain-containing protein [Corallincola spongiicola]
MATNSFVAEKRFFDDKNYPRGFSRSGDFTKQEAALLESQGRTYQALYEGTRAPATAEEQAFVDTFQTEQTATTPETKIWEKYLKRTQKRRVFTLFGSSKQSSDESDDDSPNDDIDVDDLDDAVGAKD